MPRASRWFPATRYAMSRVFRALGILLLAICLAELALAGARLLRAERPGPGAWVVVPEHFWSALREMEEQARSMGWALSP